MRRLDVPFWWPRLARLLTGAAGTIVLAIAGVVRNKWLAHHLDTIGIGVLSQVVAGQVWIGTAAGMALSLPVARVVGAASAPGAGLDAARRAVWSAGLLALTAASVAAAVGLVAAPWISQALLGTPYHADLIRLSMIGVIGIALTSPAQGFFAGRSDVRAGLTFALVGGGGTALLAFALVPRFGLWGGVTAVTLLYPLGVAGMWAFHARAHHAALEPRPTPLADVARREAGPLLRVAGAALALSLIDLGTMLALRAHYVRAFGVQANGLLQAALALSQQVGAIFYAYLAGYAFGKVSSIATTEGTAGVRAYTRRQWTPLIGLAAIAIAVALVGSAPLLRLLYSSRFDAAQPLMAYALFGEMGRVVTQAAALGALVVGGTGLWFAIGMAQPLLIAAAYACLVASGAGPESLPIAYATAGWATFAWALARLSRRGVTLHVRGLAVAVIAFVALGLLARWVAAPR